MKLKDKRINLSIKWKTFVCFGIFTICIITILWLFQIVFLEDFYKLIKFNKIKSCANSISRSIEKNNFEKFTESFSEDGVSVKVIDENFEEIYSYYGDEIGGHSMLSDSLGNMSYWRKEAIEHGGTYSERFSDYKRKLNEAKYNNDMKSDKPKPHILEGIVYVKMVYDNNGREYTVCLATLVTPVRSTSKTLRVQIFYIMIVLIALSCILSVILSQHISKPIIAITKNAKRLSAGTYTPSSVKTGYREIDELNETLDCVSDELKKAEKLKQDIIANVSHDLRTPLTMITGYAEVMRDIPGESTPENIQIIIDEAKRLELLVNDLLELSKLQSGTQKLNEETFIITEAVQQAIERLGKFTEQNGYRIEFYDLLELSKLQSGTQKLNEETFIITEAVQQAIERLGKFTEQNGYRIEFYYDSLVKVKADQLRISQVIYNLIINALNYTGDDKLVIVKQTVDSGNVIISVKDSGKGIPPDRIKFIWNRYCRLSKSGKRANIGTGLGLSIVSSVMNMHGGKYGVESTVGKGSEFWISLSLYNESL